MSLALLLIFLALAAAGVPLAVALGIAEGVALLAFSHLPLNILAQLIFSGLDSFTLVIVPFFILTGILVNEGGLAERVFRFAESWLGWMPGGRGQAAIFATVILGGAFDPAVSDVVTTGCPQEYGTSLALSSSVPAALMPPSILIVMAGAAAHESTGRLLIGGIAPGVLIALLLMLYNPLGGRSDSVGTPSPFDFKDAVEKTVAAVPVLLGLVILPGGILLDLYTPTETAAFAAAYMLFVAVLVCKKIAWHQIPDVLAKSARLTGTILAVAVAARAAGWILQYDGLPERFMRLLGGLPQSPIIVMILTGLFTLLASSFMEPTASIFILVPVLLPEVKSLGIDPIHFLLCFVTTLAIGLITPPAGYVFAALHSQDGLPPEPPDRRFIHLRMVLAAAVLVIGLVPELVMLPLKWFGL